MSCSGARKHIELHSSSHKQHETGSDQLGESLHHDLVQIKQCHDTG
jgi:hypothetical protein